MAHRDFQDARAEPLERLGALGIAEHPRCRLPRPEIRRRLADYAERLR